LDTTGQGENFISTEINKMQNNKNKDLILAFAEMTKEQDRKSEIISRGEPVWSPERYVIYAPDLFRDRNDKIKVMTCLILTLLVFTYLLLLYKEWVMDILCGERIKVSGRLNLQFTISDLKKTKNENRKSKTENCF